MEVVGSMYKFKVALGVCQRRQQSVRYGKGLSEKSAVCQIRQGSVRGVGGLSDTLPVCQTLANSTVGIRLF